MKEEEVEEIIPFAAVEEKPTFMRQDPSKVFPNWHKVTSLSRR